MAPRSTHPKLNPCGTTTAGVFLAGACQAPKDIPDTVASAEGAASAASIPIHRGEVELEPYFASCIEERCAGCGMCVNLCPYSALALVEKEGRKVMEVTEAKCKGCGTCGGFCRRSNLDEPFRPRLSHRSMHSCSEVSSKCQHHPKHPFKSVNPASGSPRYRVLFVTGVLMPVLTFPGAVVYNTRPNQGSPCDVYWAYRCTLRPQGICRWR